MNVEGRKEVGQTYPSIHFGKHFIIFCFLPSLVLITGIQPVLNCLSLLIKQKVIRGLAPLQTIGREIAN